MVIILSSQGPQKTKGTDTKRHGGKIRSKGLRMSKNRNRMRMRRKKETRKLGRDIEATSKQRRTVRARVDTTQMQIISRTIRSGIQGRHPRAHKMPQVNLVRRAQIVHLSLPSL
jgi:septum formation inhibitor MinC